MTVLSPHNVTGRLSSKGSLWLSNSCLLKYQAMFFFFSGYIIRGMPPLNPAAFLAREQGEVEHDGE